MKNKKLFFSVGIVLLICFIGGNLLFSLGSSKRKALKAVHKYYDIDTFDYEKIDELSSILSADEWLSLFSNEKLSDDEQIFVLEILGNLNFCTNTDNEAKMLKLYKQKENELSTDVKQEIINQALGVIGCSSEWEDIAVECFVETDSLETMRRLYYNENLQYSEKFINDVTQITSEWLEERENYSDEKLMMALIIQLSNQDNKSDETIDLCMQVLEEINDKLFEEQNNYDLHFSLIASVSACENKKIVKFFDDLYRTCNENSDEYSNRLINDFSNYDLSLLTVINKCFVDNISEEEVNEMIELYNYIMQEVDKDLYVYTENEINIFAQKLSIYKEKHPDAKLIDKIIVEN